MVPLKSHQILFVSICIVLLVALGLWPAQQAQAAVALDGLRDGDYGLAMVMDPAGDLASNSGPADWVGTAWSDLTGLYCAADSQHLYVYVTLTDYQQSVSSGRWGLLLNTAVGGGSTDPWGNAISFAHTDLPDYIIRGNIPGIGGNPPDDNNGWTELRAWGGSAWSAGGTNWGGIGAGSQSGTYVAYANHNGVELKIPLTDIGISSGSVVDLQFFTTQAGGSKGAYDTVPSDDQSTGWDDATTLSQWASCTLGMPPTPTNTPDPEVTPTNTPEPTATPSGDCSGATAGDGVLNTSALYHLDTDSNYRNPLGPIVEDGSSTIRLRTCAGDAEAVDIFVWKTGDPLASPSNVYGLSVVSTVDGYDFWEVSVPGPGSAINQWYQFRLTDGGEQDFYHPANGNTGVGVWSDILANPSWSLATIMPTPAPPTAYTVPTWIEDAVIYQIFPDRFRNGDNGNDPGGATVYGPGGCAAYPHGPGPSGDCVHAFRGWQDPILIPSWGLDFYGGDLQGVIDKINEGYFNDLGVNTLYFNPIFEASSNHGYDTNDYYNVRAYFGDNALFDQLIAAADAHGLQIILDAVFNHAGMDSIYLDPYNDWAGTDGACETVGSAYRPWFTPGSSGNGICDGGWGWTGWYGYDTLPEFVDGEQGVRDFFFAGGSAQSPSGVSVSQFWLDKGIAGWRYDVAQDITHDFFSEMRPYVKGENTSGTVYGNAEYLMLGEVTGGCDWYLYQSYLNANELDSVMNYCFRDWARGFADGDAPSNFDGAYNAFRALYPQPTFYGMMNLISTHDSPRMLSLLNEDKGKFKLAVLLQMTLPGAPSVYYGDEVALPGQSDPDNRRVYPWADTGGMNGMMPDTDMYNYFKTVIGLRNSHSALRGGEVTTLLIDDGRGLYSYIRYDENETAVVVLNNSLGASTATVPMSGYLPDGTVLTDTLNGGTYTVSGGSLVVAVTGQWGVVLVTDELVSQAPAVAPTAVGSASNGGTTFNWTDDAGNCGGYELYRNVVPYVAPAGAAHELLAAGTEMYVDSEAVGTARYFYIWRALGCDGSTADSAEVGVFGYNVTVGGP
ncbi:MAG TPA: glycoside hydrolase family 13 protein [Anaerolineae bacterium]|nr:glycoside hydrolase family 13 protein [Anaerolineae bacterium]